MSRFVDVYMDPCVPGYPVYASPRWATELVPTDAGGEQVNMRWSHPLHRYTLPEAVRTMEVFNAIRDHWLVMRGPGHTWPFRDPLDFASVPLKYPNTVPTISRLDQNIGVADGTTASFQLSKLYQRGTQQYRRQIRLPVLSTLLVAIGGTLVSSSRYTVSRPGGVVTFDTAPGTTDAGLGFNGQAITAGFLFDVEVRFEADDSFDGIVRTFQVGGFADISLIERRGC